MLKYRYLSTEVKQHRDSQYLDGWEVFVHPISKEKADQLLATGVVSHREELIQYIALHPHWRVHLYDDAEGFKIHK
jgi:hypothetical protein